MCRKADVLFCREAADKSRFAPFLILSENLFSRLSFVIMKSERRNHGRI